MVGGAKHLLLIGAGGCAGAIARYLVTAAAFRLLPASRMPWGTLTVNVVGCFLIGLAAGYAEARELARPEIRLAFVVGFLGAFTTFSAFGIETLGLLQENRLGSAVANVLLQVGFGLVATWLGLRLATP